MNSEYRQQYTLSIIAEMRRALADPDDNPVDHACRHATTARITDAGAVEVSMSFGQVPTFLATRTTPSDTRESFVVDTVQTNPHTPVIRITSNYSVSLGFTNPESDDFEPHLLSEKQQDILNTYTAAAAFQLTGLANGELLHSDTAHTAPYLDPHEILNSISERLYDALTLATDLNDRAKESSDTNDPTANLAQGLVHALSAARSVLAPLQRAILDEHKQIPPEESRWSAAS